MRIRHPTCYQKTQIQIREQKFSRGAAKHLEIIKTDRVELYTFDYAHNFNENKEKAIKDYINVTNYLEKEFPKIELNAGHDLNLENLKFFLDKINNIKEVSIGHALICDTFEFGLQETIKKYLTLTNN